MQNKLNRRKSRAVAMELLYSGTVNARSGEITEEFLDDFISMSDTTDNLDRPYIRKILNIVEGKEDYLKGVIRPFLKDWDINRLSRVNLAILKIAAGELLFMDDIPERVSLNEAIELSKTYSDEESTSFINGVLDKILKAKMQGTIEEEPAETEITTEQEVQAETGSEPGTETETTESSSDPDFINKSESETNIEETKNLSETTTGDTTEATPVDIAEEITEATPVDIAEEITEATPVDITEDLTEDSSENKYENAYEDLYEDSFDEETKEIVNATKDIKDSTEKNDLTETDDSTETEEDNYNY